MVIKVRGGVNLPIFVLFFWLGFNFFEAVNWGRCTVGGRTGLFTGLSIGFEGKEGAEFVTRSEGRGGLCPSCPSGVTAVP